MLNESSLIPIDPALLALMHGSFGGEAGLTPFAREILLLETEIAGTSHRDLREVEPTLKQGALLVLRREPDNTHDSLAIMVFDEAGHHLGYLPRAQNETVARLMDAGKFLLGRLLSRDRQGTWLQIEMQVLLRDF